MWSANPAEMLRMTRNHDCHHILRLAAIYRRIFSVLIVDVELVNLAEVNKKVVLTTKKCCVFLLLLLASALASAAIVFQTIHSLKLPLTEYMALYFIVISNYFAFAFPLIQAMFNYREIYNFWCKIYETTCFALSELGYEIGFGYFWKRFLHSTAICIVINVTYALVRIWLWSLKFSFGTQCCLLLQQGLVVFIVVHALFVVNLNSFFVRLLIKYVNLDYRYRASNLVFDHVERSLLNQLRLYKQFHYKLWEMTTAVNMFFGLTLLVLSYHSFVHIAYAAYYIFLYISRRDPAIILLRNNRLHSNSN